MFFCSNLYFLERNIQSIFGNKIKTSICLIKNIYQILFFQNMVLKNQSNFWFSNIMVFQFWFYGLILVLTIQVSFFNVHPMQHGFASYLSKGFQGGSQNEHFFLFILFIFFVFILFIKQKCCSFCLWNHHSGIIFQTKSF